MPSVDELRAKINQSIAQRDTVPGDVAPPSDAAPEAPRPVEVAAVTVPTPAPPRELKQFRVALVWNPTLVIEGWDRLDAIEKYKQRCGIIATPHPFKVDELTPAGD